MDKKITALLGAAAAVTTVTGAHATVSAPSAGLNPPASYRELLDPIPNAVAALRADDARNPDSLTPAELQVAENYHHHHHHHHHHVMPRPLRRLLRHHHHHHHHHSYRHHHHHHHHHY